ncbi:MAG: DUF6531 domain-containing protein [Chloroflexi bacterium]|nr:DUF6531 domain-containing protein [Chloroflexota bacterium]
MEFRAHTVDQLIDAITAINGISSGTHSIQLRANQEYVIENSNNSDTNGASAFPIVNKTIVVYGNGATIRRNTTAPALRFFHVGSTGNLRLNGLTLQAGNLRGINPIAGLHGACIRNAGTLHLVQCKLLNNLNDMNAGYGGAIYSTPGSTLTVEDSLIYGNEASNAAIASDGTLLMTNCVISANKGTIVGGIGGSANATLTHCIIASNTAQDAGGIRWGGASGQLTVNYCDIFLNRANNSGGCFFLENGSGATVNLQYNRIFDNYSVDVSSLTRDVSIAFPKTIDARYTWWGANNGPSGEDPSNNTLQGIGDSISRGVQYYPFRETSEPVHDGVNFCPINDAALDSSMGTNPISLRLGEKRLELTDLSLQTPAGSLNFTRYFRQFKQTDDPNTFFRLMGLGWTHNHNFRLVDETNLTPPRLVLLSPNGGTVVFNIQLSSTQYQAAEGSSSLISINSGSTTARYTMTSADKTSYEFDSNKKLRKITLPNKEYWTYRYFGDDSGESTHFALGELKEVVDDFYDIDPTATVVKRKLQFVYIQNPTFLNAGVPTAYGHTYLLWRIGDHTASNLTGSTPTGRYIQLGYIPERNNGALVGANPKALLGSVSDIRNATRLWTYNYYGQASGENISSQVNWLIDRKTPNVDTNGDQVADNILTLEKLSYDTHQVDLAVNGDMESDSDWTNVGAVTTNERSTMQVPPGQFARRVITSSIGTGIQGQIWRLVKGRQYTISVKIYVKLTSGSPKAKMQITGTTAFDQITSTTNSWQTLTVANYVPTATTDCKIQFVASTLDSSGNIEFFVDSVSILETNLQITQQRGLTGSNPAALLDTIYKFAPGLDYSLETTVALTKTHQFKWGQYAAGSDAASHISQQTIDLKYRVNNQQDANGNSTRLNWSNDGKHLESVVDSSGNQTQFSYNTNPIDTLDFSIDAEGRKTKYIYGDTVNNPRLPTEIKVFDVNGTTVLHWQKFIYDATKGRVTEERLLDPADSTGNTILQKTTRTYYTSGNGNGLLQSVAQVDLQNASNTVTNTYTYDTFGRITQTKQSRPFGECCGNITTYDSAGNVLSSTNVRDWSAPSDPIKNPVTNYSYDEMGRRVQTTVNVGAPGEQATYTNYDALNRVIRTINNYKNPGGTTYAAPGNWVWDSPNQAWKDGTGGGAVTISHGTDNTQNIISDTQYNARGMVKLQRDTLGNISLMGYDDAGRLVKTIQSASIQSGTFVPYNNDYVVIAGSPNSTPDPDLSEYGSISFPYSSAPDQDVWSLQTYDAAGNVVKTEDVLGNVNFKVYDNLNRPIKTVRSAKDSATIALNPGDVGYVEGDDPRSPNYAPDNSPDRDITDITIYDAMGRVVQQIDVNGRINYIAYDAQGRVSKTIANYVEQLDANGFATQPQDWTWDASATVWRRSSVPNDTAINHGMANDQNIITWTTYDSTGRVLWTQDILGRRNLSVYDGLSRVVKTVANYIPQGSTNPFNWLYSTANNRWEDGAGNAIAMGTNFDQNRISATTYDGNGRVQWTQDANGRKNWTVYDVLGRVKKNIANCTYISGSPAPESDSYVGSSNADDDIITKTTYDNDGRVYQTFDPLNRETRYFYDILGRRTRTVINYVDGVYNPAQPDKDLIQTTEYDRAGRVTTTTDARGTQTTFTYDHVGRRVAVTQAANTLIATIKYTCYDKAGRVLRTIKNWRNDPTKPAPDTKDSGGNWLFVPDTYGADSDSDLIMTFTYDKLGRRTQVIDPLGNFSVTSYFKDGSVDAITDPENMITKYRYDKLRRRFRVVQSYGVQGSSDPQNWVWDSGLWKQATAGTTIVHGTNQDLNIIVDVAFDKAGRVVSQRDPLGRLITYSYDALDRRITLVRPITSSTTQQWTTTYSDVAGGKTRTTVNYPGLATGGAYDVYHDFDRLGQLASIQYSTATDTPHIKMTYDKVGSRLSMSEYVNSNFTTLNRQTNFAYDDMRRLTSAAFDTDGNGTTDETVSYAYDAGSLRTRLTLPGNLQINYAYDTKGQLVSLTDWDNQQTVFGYDKAGRHVATSRSNGLSSRYDHDPAGRLRQIRHHQRNKMVARFQYTVDKQGNRTSAFEQLARPSTTVSTIDKANGAVSYETGTWADSGVYKQTSDYFARMIVTFTGNEGALTVGTGSDHSIFDVYIDGSLWESFDGYAASNEEKVINFYLDSSGTHTLEIRNRPERHPANTTGYKVRFKQLAILNTVYDQQTIAYGYDLLSRLLTANYADVSPTRSYLYAFDRAGNRTQQGVTIGGTPTTTNYTYNAGNQLINDGTNNYEYDANGNLTQVNGSAAYTWDKANRLLSYGGVSYKYDGDRRRVQQTFNSVITKYLLDTESRISVVLSEVTGVNTTRHIHSLRGIHAHKDASNNWEWMVPDGLGSVRAVVDTSIGIVESQNYDPFGYMYSHVGLSQTNYNFTGEPLDNNGLTYMRSRYYSPLLGIFISADSIIGADLYQYAAGNPVRYSDRTGALPCDTNNPGIQDSACLDRIENRLGDIQTNSSLLGVWAPTSGGSAASTLLAHYLDASGSTFDNWAYDWLDPIFYSLTEYHIEQNLKQSSIFQGLCTGGCCNITSGMTIGNILPYTGIRTERTFGGEISEENRNILSPIPIPEWYYGLPGPGKEGVGLFNDKGTPYEKLVGIQNPYYLAYGGISVVSAAPSTISNSNFLGATGTFDLTTPVEFYDYYDWLYGGCNSGGTATGTHPMNLRVGHFIALEEAGRAKPFNWYSYAEITMRYSMTCGPAGPMLTKVGASRRSYPKPQSVMHPPCNTPTTRKSGNFIDNWTLQLSTSLQSKTYDTLFPEEYQMDADGNIY